MLEGYVSIITPCYNREKNLFRFLDSVLMQSYKHLHLILIDDGSSDDTLSVIRSYKSRFEAAGMMYEYHSKENGGVSSAINEGLKYVQGEFLCWPDSDDWYEPDAMRKRVDFLNEHKEYGIVSCDADYCFETSLGKSQGYVSGKTKNRFSSRQFDLMLKGKTLICPICHMVRTEAFFDTHSDGKIYDSRHGQNIQMLLPVYYSYRRGFIDEALCHYLISENSLSRSNDSFEKKLSYRDSIEQIMVETLISIQMSDRERSKYIRYTRIKNTKRRLRLAYEFKDMKFAHEQLVKLKHLKAIGIFDLIIYIKIYWRTKRNDL